MNASDSNIAGRPNWGTVRATLPRPAMNTSEMIPLTMNPASGCTTRLRNR
jgi:hypothetical protein